tara:strand:- start:4072 stop:4293 length:222 start_codon:yes stop_codon:yes gene_type:complete
MEYLTVNIYEHMSINYTYIVWNKEILLGEIVEDDIMKLLNKEQIIDFYHRDKHKFKVSVSDLNSLLEKPKSND